MPIETTKIRKRPEWQDDEFEALQYQVEHAGIGSLRYLFDGAIGNEVRTITIPTSDLVRDSKGVEIKVTNVKVRRSTWMAFEADWSALENEVRRRKEVRDQRTSDVRIALISGSIALAIVLIERLLDSLQPPPA